MELGTQKSHNTECYQYDIIYAPCFGWSLRPCFEGKMKKPSQIEVI